MSVAIVKYNAGNIYSVVNALRRLGVEPFLSDDAEVLRRSDHVIFPGQGEARSAMEYLRHKRLDRVICSLIQPVLGICIGQQLLCRHSEEGDTGCLGIFDVDVKRFQPQQHEEKVPCMGWNSLELNVSSLNPQVNPLFEGLTQPWVYFVHSYYVPICENTIATANYILPYSAALHKDNFYTCQFHPEKSGEAGEIILRNFLRL
ncbi:MAG: imidazole glycerol phosphate synthase subunit HisH [Prevotella sp.]|nr:imidazole glycerol phosphate synthase subunit HisH [Prevotella sp.]